LVKARIRQLIGASSLLALLLTTSQTHAAPSRAFLQELGRVNTGGHIYVDLYNNTGTWTPPADSQIRVATPYGEGILSENSIGAKGAVADDMSAYLIGYVNTGPGTAVDLTAGMAYQIRQADLYLNLNPYVSSSKGSLQLHFATAVFTRLSQAPSWLDEVQLGAEFQTPASRAYNTGTAIGLRWLPRDFLTFDLILAGDGGDRSTTIRTPAALRFNLRF